ncbi:MAG: sigma-54 dependent transcriptional regulator, partial [Nitrospirota bacterium]
MSDISDILVVDDQSGMRKSLAILLKKEGYNVDEAAGGEYAIECLNHKQFDLVITDLKMSPVTGIDVLKYVKKEIPQTEVIIMTAYGTVDSAVEAMKIGAFDYISKPFKNEEILHRIRKSIEHSKTVKELYEIQKESRKKLFPIIGQSKAIKKIISLIERVAKVELPVLITGETGTGKNLIAKTIHINSSRADKPYVSLNCATVPEYLLESELFGHTKGAFTGAILERRGLFEEADGGSFLLDEIGNIHKTMQAKLLGVLQDQTIRRVGSNRDKSINVRIMAATNRDLEEAVMEGEFREDLYYRLKVLHVHIPPLREYREDIPLLASHFLGLCRDKFKKPEIQFSPEVINILYQYDYPGNVRELYNIICQVVALSSDSVITIADLPADITQQILVTAPLSNDLVKPQALEEWEKEVILQSIKRHSHNLAMVCREL